MTDKIDLVMWTRNGAWCLSSVLQRINEVIPNACCKIMIDDGSTDNTAAIGRKYGWQVTSTKGIGIGYAAQLALDQVDTDIYCSFEQDVLLHPKWLQTVYPQLLKDDKTAVVQGARLSSLKPMRVIEQWRWQRIPYFMSIDNNINRTAAIREVGGYPKRFFGGVDTGLHDKLRDAGWNWKVDRSIVSTHLRKSLKSDITRLYRYHILGRGEGWNNSPLSSPVRDYAKKLLTSPILGLMIAIEYGYLPIALIYPLIRFYSFKGLVESIRNFE